MQSVQHTNNNAAIQAVKKRFVRLPSNYSSPRFRDLISGIEQSDITMLASFYRKKGGKEHGAEYILECLDTIFGDTFKPGAGVIVDGEFLNLWQPSLIKPSGQVITPEMVKPFIEFMDRWFPDRSERAYFMWWLAHIIRRPEKRITATPLLRTEQGVGKGFLTETLLSRLIGENSWCLASLSRITGEHNEALEGKILVVIDEVQTVTPKALNDLKSFQGNYSFLLNRKHKSIIKVENYVNFIMTSNTESPFTIETGDRRYWVPAFIRHKESVSETDRFINDVLKPWLEIDGFQLVRDYLEFVDLDTYRPTGAPPMTDSKRELMGAGEKDLDELIEPLIKQNKVLTVDKIKTAISKLGDAEFTEKAISEALKAKGCHPKRTNSQRFYITPAGLKSGLSTTSPPKQLAANV